MTETPTPATIAVLDVGKSNIKLSACTTTGAVLETLSTPNPVLPGPPWQHHDLVAIGEWLFLALSALCRRHPIGHVIASGHGSCCALVGDDPDGPGGGVVLPMVDYEQTLPKGLMQDYAPLSGGFLDRGSAMMLGASHMARQMFWAERDHPQAFARVQWALGLPQYWAWRLSGVAVSERTILGAQSHLWNVPAQGWSPIVAARGWARLLPPLARASADLGPLRPALAARYGLPPGLRVHAGIHDSSANFYRYQAAGQRGVTVLSTGTWIVALADGVDPARLLPDRGMTLNSDVDGAALGGALAMVGRDYALLAGEQPADPRVDPGVLARLIAQGSMALPSFSAGDGQFPGSANQGHLIGPPPQTAPERHALAVLYTALMSVACAASLGPDRPLILDGTFLRDPAYAALMAALRPGLSTRFAPESHGIAAGTAVLCAGTAPALPLLTPPPIPGLPDLAPYATTWRRLTEEGPRK